MKQGRVIGIAGAGRGTGATHLCIWMANYLSGCCGRRTAVLQWNSHGDFEALERIFFGASGGKGMKYRLLDGVYLKQGSTDVLADCLEEGYEEILIDFGQLESRIRGEWLRCSVRLLTISLAEWKLEACLGLLVREDGLGKGWTGAVLSGSEDTRKQLERQFGIRLERVPFSADAFSVERRDMDWFEKLLK